MRSRTIREGSAGLLILLGATVLGALILWLRGFDPSKRSYLVTVQFPDAVGMQVGAPVRYRGVAAGKIAAIRVSPNYAEVDLKIAPTTIIIPKQSVLETSQSGLVGETYIDITPTTVLPTDVLASANPLSSDCNSDLIVCNGDYIQGTPGITLAELTDSVVRFLDLFSTPEFVAEVRALTRNSSNAAAGVATLTREVTKLTQSVDNELEGLTRATSRSATSIGQAATQFGITATQINQLLSDNRSTISRTLDSISRTSTQIEGLIGDLSPTLSNQDSLFQNLQALSANAAQASENLRSVTEMVGSPENMLILQQTLDSARTTFQNTQKITSDLDELTGDPNFRQNVRDLINSLNDLVSSTQELQQQTEIAYLLSPAEAALYSANIIPSSDAPPMTVLDSDHGVRLQPFTADELIQDVTAPDQQLEDELESPQQ